MVHLWTVAEPEGGQGGHLPHWLRVKFPIVILRDWNRKKKGKKMAPETWKWFWHKEKKIKKKKFLKHQIIFFFHLFYCSSKFSLVPRLTPILQFFSFLISIILFTVYNTFCSILLLNDTRDITNFTIYIFKN